MTRMGLYYVDYSEDEARLQQVIEKWQPPVAVLLNTKTEIINLVARAAPKALIFLRDHPLSEQHSDLHADPAGFGRHAARTMVQKAISMIPADCDRDRFALLGINEPDAQLSNYAGQTADHICDYYAAFAPIVHEAGFRPAGPDFGIGWPSYNNWAPFERLHDTARTYNGIITFHRYYRADFGINYLFPEWVGAMPPDTWKDVQWAITEWGDDGLIQGRKRRADGGWEPSGWSDVYPADGERYIEDMKIYDAFMARYPNLLGAAIFMYAKSPPWQSYAVTDIAWKIAEYAEASRPVIEPPLPEPEPEVRPSLLWPIRDIGFENVTQWHGERKADYSRFGLIAHNGIDIAAAFGTPVIASHDGQTWVYNDPGGYGNTVEIWQPKVSSTALYKTIYAHLSRSTVGNRAYVEQGDVIGLVGSTGNSTGPHLHWGYKPLGLVNGRKPTNVGYRDWVDPLGAMIDYF